MSKIIIDNNENQTNPFTDISQLHLSESTSQNSDKSFNEIMHKHNISGFWSKKLKNLNNFKIVFILDDSGSMAKVLEDSPLNKSTYKATR